MASQLTISSEQAELAALRAFMEWLAPRVEVRDGNGRINRSMCVVCKRGGTVREMGPRGYPITKYEPCRHDLVWRYIKDGRGQK